MGFIPALFINTILQLQLPLRAFHEVVMRWCVSSMRLSKQVCAFDLSFRMCSPWVVNKSAGPAGDPPPSPPAPRPRTAETGHASEANRLPGDADARPPVSRSARGLHAGKPDTRLPPPSGHRSLRACEDKSRAADSRPPAGAGACAVRPERGNSGMFSLGCLFLRQRRSRSHGRRPAGRPWRAPSRRPERPGGKGPGGASTCHFARRPLPPLLARGRARRPWATKLAWRAAKARPGCPKVWPGPLRETWRGT